MIYKLDDLKEVCKQMLINLIYASTANSPMSEQELLDLLKKARIKNESLDITGLLLYYDQSFLQVLEGEEKTVHELYERIQKDSRHRAVVTIGVRSVKTRVFSDWQMGFVDLHQVKPESVIGYSDYLNISLNSSEVTKNPSFAYAFLEAFKSVVTH